MFEYYCSLYLFNNKLTLNHIRFFHCFSRHKELSQTEPSPISFLFASCRYSLFMNDYVSQV